VAPRQRLVKRDRSARPRGADNVFTMYAPQLYNARAGLPARDRGCRIGSMPGRVPRSAAAVASLRKLAQPGNQIAFGPRSDPQTLYAFARKGAARDPRVALAIGKVS